MDWITILSLIGTLLGGAGITQIINWGAQKRKANLENKQIEVNTDSTAVETLKDAIAEIRTSNDHFQAVIADREHEINKLREENLSKDKDIILCQSMLCKKMCCKTRKPIVGLGEKFLNDLKAGKEKLDYENQ